MLLVEAYWLLVHFGMYLKGGDFSPLYAKVRHCPVRSCIADQDIVERVRAAVDVACIWYWKEALCLQRSAATVCLLKRHGVAAQMVIGAQLTPFKAHAWVEVDGLSEKPHATETYAVLDRC